MPYSLDILTGGVATASSKFQDEGYFANYACDNNEETRWCNFYPGVIPEWWKYDLGNGITKKVTKLRFKSYVGIGIENFILQGSNDDINWTDIYNGIGDNSGNWEEFIFSNNNNYRYYRIYITSVYLPDWATIWEIEMMEEVHAGFSQSIIIS